MVRLFMFYFLTGCLFMACRTGNDNKNKLGLNIRLSADSTALLVENLPAELLAELNKHGSDSVLEAHLFAVYPEPEDPDLRDVQKPLPGNYLIYENFIEFRPAVPFKKNQAYFVQVYPKNLGLNLFEMLQKNGWQRREGSLEYKFTF